MSEGICHWPFYCLKSEKDLACLAQGGFSSWNENKNEYSIKQEKCAISSLCIALGGNPSNSPQRRNGKVNRHLETCIIKESINLRNSARVHEQDWRHLKGRKKKKDKKERRKDKESIPSWWESRMVWKELSILVRKRAAHKKNVTLKYTTTWCRVCLMEGRTILICLNC